MSETPNRPYFVTGDDIFAGSFWIALQFPASAGNWLYAQFLASLENMGNDNAWLWGGGESTAQEAATAMRTVYLSGIFDMPWSIGDIKFTTAPPDAATWLLCDGALYLQSAYLALYGRIGTAYNQSGDPTDSFRVPDMRGRVAAMTNNGSGILPSWANIPGGIGGEAAHQLTIHEMPNHSHADLGHTHSEGNALPTIINGGLEAPAPAATPSVGVTGIGNAVIENTGDDGSHNNIQPTMALACYILAEY